VAHDTREAVCDSPRDENERAVTLAYDDGHVTPDILSPKCSSCARRSAANGGNQTRSAVGLGLSGRALIDKLQKYGIR
jgi:hypothetical protein